MRTAATRVCAAAKYHRATGLEVMIHLRHRRLSIRTKTAESIPLVVLANDQRRTNQRPVDNCRYHDYCLSMAKGIQAELKQTKPFSSVAEEAFIALMRTADQLQWKGAELMKRVDVSPTQFNDLRILRGAEPNGLPCSQ